MAEDRPVIARVWEEQSQGHATRQSLYEKIEDESPEKLPVIAFFTSFVYPVMIEDADANMIEATLHQCDFAKGFTLLLSSPGGDGLAAERILNICRSNSGTGKYEVLVIGKAKSAATMICLGASKIVMGKTSELGPIDPQMAVTEDKRRKVFSVYNLIKSYEELFRKAVKEKGNLQPYLQQLANYDAREIAEFKRELELSNDIAVKALKSGMLSGLTAKKIMKDIRIFLTPENVKTHGRPIYPDEAKKCGLNIEVRDFKEPRFSSVFELYVRLNNYVSTSHIAKCVESKHQSFRVKLEED